MPSPKAKPALDAAGAGNLSPLARSIVSLVIVIHFCCVFTVLASNYRRSPLLSRLVRIFAVYTQAFNFDPNLTPYHLTLGREVDDDAVLQIDLYPDGESPVTGQTLMQTIELPDRGSRWMEGRRRYLALAKIIQNNAPEDREANPDEDAAAAEIAKAVGRRIIEENVPASGKRPRAVVRCVRRMSQPRNLADLDPGFPPNNPAAPAYDIPLYTADVYIDEDGQTQIVKRASRSELAPRQTNP